MGLAWQLLILLLVAGLVVQGVVLVAVMRQVGGILIQLHPAHVGELEGQGPDPGTEINFPGLDLSKPAVVLFLSSNCTLCRPVVPALPALRRNYERVSIIPVVAGRDADERARYASEIGNQARADLPQLMEEWSIPGTPYAVGIRRGGVIAGSGVFNSLDQVEALAASIEFEADGEDIPPDTPPADELEPAAGQYASA